MFITLTTDFGASSPYVAAMKGVILSINPEARLVDVSHVVPPQQVLAGAQVLDDTTRYFPTGTIHVAVIDPGVGTSRKIVYAEIGAQRYVCPDNGLLSRLSERESPSTITEVTNSQSFRESVSSTSHGRDFVAPDNGLLSRLAISTPPSTIITVAEPQYWLPAVSATFHGRDIMAPVAAHLSLGIDPKVLGPPLAELRTLDWPGVEKLANRIEGEIVAIDSFGNLVTNITRDMLSDVPTDESVAVRCDGHETHSIFSAYAEQPSMTLIALVGSNDQLELAIVDDSAKIMLGVGVGAKVEVCW